MNTSNKNENPSLGLYTDLLSAVMAYGLFCFDCGTQAELDSSEKAMNKRVEERAEKYQNIVDLLDAHTEALTHKKYSKFLKEIKRYLDDYINCMNEIMGDDYSNQTKDQFIFLLHKIKEFQKTLLNKEEKPCNQ